MKKLVRKIGLIVFIGALFGLSSVLAANRGLWETAQFGMNKETWSILLSIITVAGIFFFYKLTSRAIDAVIIKHGGKEGDIQMVTGVWRFIIVFIAALTLMTIYFELGTIAAIIGAFGGMFLGWSLQAPVSGFAAWLLVSAKRPFRVGDRVQLPSYGLVGDVIDVSPMYTVLNQVGGAVGSEDAVGRHILIPNAMLFGNLVINYTPPPHHTPQLHFRSEIKSSPTFILDEVVARITFTSDWKEAERILLDAAREVTKDIIEITGHEPYIRSDMYDYGVYMRLRYMTLATDRPRITHEITQKVFEEFSKNEKVDFAIPYVYSNKSGSKFTHAIPGSLGNYNLATCPLLYTDTANIANGQGLNEELQSVLRKYEEQQKNVLRNLAAQHIRPSNTENG